MGNSNMGQKKHGFLKGVGIFLAVCLFLELGLRLFGYGNYTVYRPDERLLWVPQPGRTLTVVNHLPITINDQGFRYPFDLTPKHGNEFRIIAFGDSATQGWGVDDHSHYSAILEGKLNHENCTQEHFQVVSAGVNAYSNSLVAEKLKEVLEDNQVQPDIAIVAYSHNSNFEKLVKLQGDAREIPAPGGVQSHCAPQRALQFSDRRRFAQDRLLPTAASGHGGHARHHERNG